MLFIINSFVGNPISATMANKAIKHYVDQNYSTLNLEIEKAKYNFKYSSYWARVKSKASIDNKFTIYYKDGMVGDDYESCVLGMFNTLKRLSNEYSAVAKDIIINELGYENSTAFVVYDMEEYGNNNDILVLDMGLDKSLPIKTEVTIGLSSKDDSIEGISKVFTDTHKAFVDNGCNFSKYGLYSIRVFTIT